LERNDETVENIDVRKIISDALIKLELRIINNEIDEIKARIANAESEILDRLLKRQAELTLKRNALSQKSCLSSFLAICLCANLNISAIKRTEKPKLLLLPNPELSANGRKHLIHWLAVDCSTLSIIVTPTPTSNVLFSLFHI
jgi:hypothetical protein